MKRLLFASFMLLLFSCKKEAPLDLDKNIQYSFDFAINPATGDTVYKIYIPNAFTPNADGMNDLYHPLTIGVNPDQYEFRIYTQNSNYIFYSHEIHYGWDGAVQGRANLSPSDVYNADIRLTDTLGNEHHYIQKFLMYR